MPSNLTPQERADAARKVPRIVDQMLRLLALNEAAGSIATSDWAAVKR